MDRHNNRRTDWRYWRRTFALTSAIVLALGATVASIGLADFVLFCAGIFAGAALMLAGMISLILWQGEA